MQGTQYATKRSILCRGAFCGPTEHSCKILYIVNKGSTHVGSSIAKYVKQKEDEPDCNKVQL